jgi:biopolymer transport protein ExbB/TolQ
MPTFLSFLRDYPYAAIPMFLISFAGIGLVIWRLLLNINASTDLKEFLPVFAEKLENDGVYVALAFCRSRMDVIPRKLFVAGLENHRQGIAAVRQAMSDVLAREILPDLNFLLPAILIVAKLATMTGLLVTVISMIVMSDAIQQTRGSDVTHSANAIGLSLCSVAMGLSCAIPLVFSHVLFTAWIAQFEQKMQSAMRALLVLLVTDYF